MTGHTAGKWTVFREPDGLHWISSGTESASSVVADRIRSNEHATLIAAAPLLLEALKGLLSECELWGSLSVGMNTACESARSAIAAATGRET